MAQQLHDVDIVSRASIELVECTAKYDQAMAVTYLLLYQVCKIIIHEIHGRFILLHRVSQKKVSIQFKILIKIYRLI